MSYRQKDPSYCPCIAQPLPPAPPLNKYISILHSSHFVTFSFQVSKDHCDRTRMVTWQESLGLLSLFPHEVWPSFSLQILPVLCPSPFAPAVAHIRGLPFLWHIWQLLPQAQNQPLCKQGLRDQEKENEAKSRKPAGLAEQLDPGKDSPRGFMQPGCLGHQGKVAGHFRKVVV